MNLQVKIYENTSTVYRSNFDIYENNVELSHLYVDMSKFMAHGTWHSDIYML